MAAPRNRRHLFVAKAPSAESYSPHPRKIKPKPVPAPASRPAHGAKLKAQILAAEAKALADRAASDIVVEGAKPGLYVEFESQPGIALELEKLEYLKPKKRIELVAVTRSDGPEGEPIERATVFVPDGQLKFFISRFDRYASKKTKTGKASHEHFDRVAALRKATLRALWTDSQELLPEDDVEIWWEVWLRRDDGAEVTRLSSFASQVGMTVGGRHLAFEDRVVCLVKGTAKQLIASLDVLNDLAELRKAKETSAFFHDLTPHEQADWITDFTTRLTPPAPGSPAVCVLDTGITRAHPLLEPVCAESDAMTVDPEWGVHDNGGGPDNEGHGTAMSGLAAYGDLVPLLAGTEPIVMQHAVESVKILPPAGGNNPELYGAITAEAVSRPESVNPTRLRAFSMAITADDQRDRGQPTSWSAAVDALAAGRSFDPSSEGLKYLDAAEHEAHRLFVLSAGNVVSQLQSAHLELSDTEPVHDPAQAWNALTVGGVTEKAIIEAPEWKSWRAVAPSGDLSPWSTTSVTFQDRWPIKPDVVFEAGNVATDGTNVDFPVPELCLMAPHHRPMERLLRLSYATSAATSQIARLAIMLRADYPAYWPETVRAMVVHSARWTAAMGAHLSKNAGKTARACIARRYGAGVPSRERMLRSANDALTLVVQSSIRPFENGKLREMHVHELPWPAEVLASLAQATVTLRVTLSYFIEPNPSRRGWKDRHRYSSHGLRFDVKGAYESIDDFRKQLNKRALEEDEAKPSGPKGYDGWFFGEARNKGSIHTDSWTGTAADLATRNVIGVYPVSGWWMDLPKRDRSGLGARYALLASIETVAEDVDLWTPVANSLGIELTGLTIEE